VKFFDVGVGRLFVELIDAVQDEDAVAEAVRALGRLWDVMAGVSRAREFRERMVDCDGHDVLNRVEIEGGHFDALLEKLDGWA